MAVCRLWPSCWACMAAFVALFCCVIAFICVYAILGRCNWLVCRVCAVFVYLLMSVCFADCGRIGGFWRSCRLSLVSVAFRWAVLPCVAVAVRLAVRGCPTPICTISPRAVVTHQNICPNFSFLWLCLNISV